jgi:hypothetical protein
MRVGMMAGTALAIAACVGCGGSGSGGSGGGGGSCGDFSCGGDLVGAWSSEDACGAQATATLTVSFCPQARVERVMMTSFLATYTFNSDLTFSGSVMGGATASWVFPSECVNGGGATACASLQSEVQGLVSLLHGSVTCAPVGSTCDCTVAFDLGGSAAGSYMTAGSALTFTAPGATTTGTTTYCARGATLTMRTTPLRGIMGMTSTVVFTRLGGGR